MKLTTIPFPDLFTMENTAVRDKLRGVAERLMFPPSQFSRKGEDLIWKKGFYDLITQVRRPMMLLVTKILSLRKGSGL